MGFLRLRPHWRPPVPLSCSAWGQLSGTIWEYIFVSLSMQTEMNETPLTLMGFHIIPYSAVHFERRKKRCMHNFFLFFFLLKMNGIICGTGECKCGQCLNWTTPLIAALPLVHT